MLHAVNLKHLFSDVIAQDSGNDSLQFSLFCTCYSHISITFYPNHIILHTIWTLFQSSIQWGCLHDTQQWWEGFIFKILRFLLLNFTQWTLSSHAWWRFSSCRAHSTHHVDILKHAIWIENGQDMSVTRALRRTRIARLFMGISVREVSRLKGGVYSFLTVYNMS